MRSAVLLSLAATALAAKNCTIDYVDYYSKRHAPYSKGKYEYPWMRPDKVCRDYKVDKVEDVISNDMKDAIHDPDLYRLFQNTWPNTLDTTVKWTGYSDDDPDEELAFVITGDINAMWMRDSANQLQSYKSMLASKDIAKLYRGAINLQARYMIKSPYCNAFQPPVESGIKPDPEHGQEDVVSPKYDPNFVFECKYEIDSLAAFFQLSYDYYHATGDTDFFGKFQWKEAVSTILDVAKGLMEGTYAKDGSVNKSPYTWARTADSATETVSNQGAGEPVKGDIGLVRSFFRPSDDSTIYQYFIPGNMMFSRFVKATAPIMDTIDKNLAKEMRDIATGIEKGIEKHAIVKHPEFGRIYAFEIDGYGSYNLMDDANLPSLLSIPFMGFKSNKDPVYRNTREFVLSNWNRYYTHGPVINAIGGPHLGPGMGWPMSIITSIFTSNDDKEITRGIRTLMGSTSGLGMMHESVNSHNETEWTRPWFAWTNGLFGQMLLDLADRKPHLLKKSYQ